MLRIQYRAGYELPEGSDDDPRTAIPAVIRQWLLIRSADLYCNRESGVMGQISEVSHIRHMLDNWRVRM